MMNILSWAVALHVINILLVIIVAIFGMYKIEKSGVYHWGARGSLFKWPD
jgi:hypothetical protein